MIAMAEYKPETHKVLTEDGYILTVYRFKMQGSNCVSHKNTGWLGRDLLSFSSMALRAVQRFGS